MAIRLMAGSLLNKTRKGFLLTMIALLLVSLFVVYFQISVIRQSQPVAISNSARVNSVSSFVDDLERFYLPNIVAVSLRSSLVGMNEFLSGGNRFIAAVNQTTIFYQLITNGTMYPFNTTIFSTETLNVLLPQFTNLVNSELNIPLAINYTPYQFTITQQSPWSVSVTFVFLYSIDTPELSIINRTLQVSTSIPILGLQEPYFLINTYGAYSPNITQTNTSIWNIARLKEHIQAQEFAANPAAPSYLNRISNITTASPYGIEFFVNTTMFGFDDDPVNYSFVDYQFWTRPWDCTPILGNQRLVNITGISDVDGFENFVIDNDHASRYLNRTEVVANTTIVCS